LLYFAALKSGEEGRVKLGRNNVVSIVSNIMGNMCLKLRIIQKGVLVRKPDSNRSLGIRRCR
jgi:hypothetical protein